jgi:hypothetical protein
VLFSAYGLDAMRLTLLRSTGDSERTTGILQVDGRIFATMERPWLENQAGPGGVPRQSCVPPGIYRVDPWHSVHFPETYIITNPELGVYRQPGDMPAGQKWGRSAILIHIGNFVRNVIGCIAVGMEHGELGGEPAVLRSIMAMRELNKLLNRGTHALEIT